MFRVNTGLINVRIKDEPRLGGRNIPILQIWTLRHKRGKKRRFGGAGGAITCKYIEPSSNKMRYKGLDISGIVSGNVPESSKIITIFGPKRNNRNHLAAGTNL